MNTRTLCFQRLANQQLFGSRFQQAADLVRWFGAIQSQEYAMAKWAVGVRVSGIDDATVEQAFNDGQILRTHVLRPTWHFVAPGDIRWMLALSAPRVRAASAYMHRQVGLDDAMFRRSNAAIARALRGGQQLTRAALQRELEHAGIIAHGTKLVYLLMHAELDGLICSGARQERQFTYALLEERVPKAPPLDRDTALIELARRYYRSRGPATKKDFAWWSGLTMKDASAATAGLGTEFSRDNIDGREHFFPTVASMSRKRPTPVLLPEFDEYGIAYQDRTALFGPPGSQREKLSPASAYSQTIIVDGRIIGHWRRTEARGSMGLEFALRTPLPSRVHREIISAAERYAAFLGRPTTFTFRSP